MRLERVHSWCIAMKWLLDTLELTDMILKSTPGRTPCFIHLAECPIDCHVCCIMAQSVAYIHWHSLLRKCSQSVKELGRASYHTFQTPNRPRSRSQEARLSYEAIWRIHQLLVAMLDQITQGHWGQRSLEPGNSQRLLGVARLSRQPGSQNGFRLPDCPDKPRCTTLHITQARKWEWGGLVLKLAFLISFKLLRHSQTGYMLIQLFTACDFRHINRLSVGAVSSCKPV